MKKCRWCLVLLLLFIGAAGCAPLYVTGTASVGGLFNPGYGGFVQTYASFPDPVLYYTSYNGGALPVYPTTCVNFVPDQDGTWFTLNNGCEDAAVKVMEGGINIDYDRNGDHFWVPNTHKGGLPRNIVVTIHCPAASHPWELSFDVKSSGPRIRRW